MGTGRDMAEDDVTTVRVTYAAWAAWLEDRGIDEQGVLDTLVGVGFAASYETEEQRDYVAGDGSRESTGTGRTVTVGVEGTVVQVLDAKPNGQPEGWSFTDEDGRVRELPEHAMGDAVLDVPLSLASNIEEELEAVHFEDNGAYLAAARMSRAVANMGTAVTDIKLAAAASPVDPSLVDSAQSALAGCEEADRALWHGLRTDRSTPEIG